MNIGQNRFVILSLVLLFGCYNAMIYFQPSSSSKTQVQKMTKEAIAGEQLWQENNCTSCHQIYGLGGYLGPDVTNVISNPTKGEEYVKAILNSGINAMPQFHFDENEKNQIISFLKHVDGTGIYPNENAVFQDNGWVDIEYK